MENSNKQALLDKLKNLIYDTQFSNLQIYSKQYYFSIIYSMFKTLLSKQNFCYTFGDFNKLNDINKLYGKEAGDIAVEEALRIIKNTMPENTLICRIAGDEFAFLSPTYTRTTIDSYIKKIHSNLTQANQELTHGLSITMASMDNQAFSEFNDLYLHSELKVSEEKKISNEDDSDIESTLLKKCITSFSRFFDYYRFEERTLPKKFFSNLKKEFLNLFAYLQDPEEELLRFQMDSEQNLTIRTKTKTYKEYDQNTAQIIHKALTTDSSDVSLDQISEEDLTTLFNYLIRHPLTQQYSQKYFERVLLPNIVNGPEEDLVIHHFDILHMKLSNDLKGHDYTDKKMSELLNHIIIPVSQKNENATFVTRCGTLLLIEKVNQATPNTEILQYIENAKKNQLLLGLAHEHTTCSSKELQTAIENLELQCAEQKNIIKATKMVDPKIIKLALNTALKDPIDYFLLNFNDQKIPSTQSLKKFGHILFLALAEVISMKYPDQPTSSFDEHKHSKEDKSLDD